VFEFDPEKDRKNTESGRISLAAAQDGDWETAILAPDLRQDYGEPRLVGLLMIYGRLHVIVITPRAHSIRVISLRRANRREIRRYEQTRQP
jgi:uncharacterized DUF497 family protein